MIAGTYDRVPDEIVLKWIFLLRTIPSLIFMMTFSVLAYYWSCLFYYTRMNYKMLKILPTLNTLVAASYAAVQIVNCCAYVFKSHCDDDSCRFEHLEDDVRKISQSVYALYLALYFGFYGLKLRRNQNIPIPLNKHIHRRIQWTSLILFLCFLFRSVNRWFFPGSNVYMQAAALFFGETIPSTVVLYFLSRSKSNF